MLGHQEKLAASPNSSAQSTRARNSAQSFSMTPSFHCMIVCLLHDLFCGLFALRWEWKVSTSPQLFSKTTEKWHIRGSSTKYFVIDQVFLKWINDTQLRDWVSSQAARYRQVSRRICETTWADTWAIVNKLKIHRARKLEWMAVAGGYIYGCRCRRFWTHRIN